MRRLAKHSWITLTLGGLALAIVGGVAAAGVTGPAFYVDGELYRTVGTPADLPQNAPDHSFDTIYVMRQCQSRNVATAAPGDTDFNGGRWRVHRLAFDDCVALIANFDYNDSGDLDSAEEVEDALDAGAAVDLGVIRSFLCPVIPVPAND